MDLDFELPQFDFRIPASTPPWQPSSYGLPIIDSDSDDNSLSESNDNSLSDSDDDCYILPHPRLYQTRDVIDDILNQHYAVEGLKVKRWKVDVTTAPGKGKCPYVIKKGSNVGEFCMKDMYKNGRCKYHYYKLRR